MPVTSGLFLNAKVSQIFCVCSDAQRLVVILRVKGKYVFNEVTLNDSR